MIRIMNTEISVMEQEILYDYASDILASHGMQQEKEYKQHGEISCYEHSIAVACMSIRLADLFHIKVNKKSLTRGALLHDYFLYDWHHADKSHRLHGFIHAKRALQNAEHDFSLTDIERDIIAKHMFPLNPSLPRYKESVIVTAADKICASHEVLACVFPFIKAEVSYCEIP